MQFHSLKKNRKPHLHEIGKKRLHLCKNAHSPIVDIKYGNTGCGVFLRGVENWKDFCLRINISKTIY